MNNVYENLNHTKWECKYQVIFIPKISAQGTLRITAVTFGELVSGVGRVQGASD
jgi:hypothetical protein